MSVPSVTSHTCSSCDSHKHAVLEHVVIPAWLTHCRTIIAQPYGFMKSDDVDAIAKFGLCTREIERLLLPMAAITAATTSDQSDFWKASWNDRSLAILGKLKSPHFVEIVKKLYKGSDDIGDYCKALGKIESENAVQLLTGVACNKEENHEVRALAAKALRRQTSGAYHGMAKSNLTAMRIIGCPASVYPHTLFVDDMQDVDDLSQVLGNKICLRESRLEAARQLVKSHDPVGFDALVTEITDGNNEPGLRLEFLVLLNDLRGLYTAEAARWVASYILNGKASELCEVSGNRKAIEQILQTSLWQDTERLNALIEAIRVYYPGSSAESLLNCFQDSLEGGGVITEECFIPMLGLAIASLGKEDVLVKAWKVFCSFSQEKFFNKMCFALAQSLGGEWAQRSFEHISKKASTNRLRKLQELVSALSAKETLTEVQAEAYANQLIAFLQKLLKKENPLMNDSNCLWWYEAIAGFAGTGHVAIQQKLLSFLETQKETARNAYLLGIAALAACVGDTVVTPDVAARVIESLSVLSLANAFVRQYFVAAIPSLSLSDEGGEKVRDHLIQLLRTETVLTCALAEVNALAYFLQEEDRDPERLSVLFPDPIPLSYADHYPFL